MMNNQHEIKSDGKELTYTEWEDQIVTNIQERLEVSRGDAQAIFEAQSFIASTGWGKGLDPLETSELIAPINAPEVKSNKSPRR